MSVNQLKLGLHQDGPEQVGHRVGSDLSRHGSVRDRRFRQLPFSSRRRAAKRGPEDVIDDVPRRTDRAGPGNGTPGKGGSSRFMFGSVPKMKNRSCGFSVEPTSARALSTSTLPRNCVNPLPVMS